MASTASLGAAAFSLVLLACLTSSCGPEVKDEGDDEMARSCRLLCAQHENCETEYFQSVESIDECVVDCLETSAPTECYDELATYNECSGELACDDFLYLYSPELDPETGPCNEERIASGQCLANNR